MNDLVTHIISKAKMKGACELINNAKSITDLHDLQFSPQGMEFCKEKDFPGYGLWKLIKRHFKTRDLNLFIDEGEVEVYGCHDIAVIGSTNAEINCSGADKIYHILVQHRAKVLIKAKDYAVILVEDIGKDNEISIQKDNTVKIL